MHDFSYAETAEGETSSQVQNTRSGRTTDKQKAGERGEAVHLL